jgi:hypothetical protein
MLHARRAHLTRVDHTGVEGELDLPVLSRLPTNGGIVGADVDSHGGDTKCLSEDVCIGVVSPLVGRWAQAGPAPTTDDADHVSLVRCRPIVEIHIVGPRRDAASVSRRPDHHDRARPVSQVPTGRSLCVKGLFDFRQLIHLDGLRRRVRVRKVVGGRRAAAEESLEPRGGSGSVELELDLVSLQSRSQDARHLGHRLGPSPTFCRLTDVRSTQAHRPAQDS